MRRALVLLVLLAACSGGTKAAPSFEQQLDGANDCKTLIALEDAQVARLTPGNGTVPSDVAADVQAKFLQVFAKEQTLHCPPR